MEETEQAFAVQGQQPSIPPPHLLKHLYVAHFLARWCARMWEFSVGLYMINIWPDSLFLAALYGVVEAASTALFGSTLGQWIDRVSYIKVLRVWLVAQNLSFIVAGGAVVALLISSSLKAQHFGVFAALVGLTNISGAVAVLSTLAGTILIEREWMVVISEGHPPEVLTKMNSVIRRIDLSCKLLAPVLVGFLISFVSLTASASIFALWATLGVWLEYWLFMSVYNGIPALSISNQKKISRVSHIEVEDTELTSQEKESFLSPNEENSSSIENSWRRKVKEKIINAAFVDAWRVYLEQDIVLPGIALALLYFTVLSFGSLMTATLEWEGIPAYVIGMARGVSAVVGITATLLYPTIQSRIQTLRTGVWSIWSQWTCLIVCVVSIWIKNNHLSAFMLMSGVAASRLGLWMFDLAVIQQMQDHVAESDRCVVGGVQNSLQSFLELLAYVMGIVVSNPQDFWVLIIHSFTVATAASFLYTLHLYRVRKHLVHVEKLLPSFQWLFTYLMSPLSHSLPTVFM